MAKPTLMRGRTDKATAHVEGKSNKPRGKTRPKRTTFDTSLIPQELLTELARVDTDITATEHKEIAQSYTREIYEILMDIASNSSSDAARIAACDKILQRGWGKPPLSQEDTRGTAPQINIVFPNQTQSNNVVLPTATVTTKSNLRLNEDGTENEDEDE